MATTPEGFVKNAVKKWLKARGIWYYMPSQNGRGVVGIPDFICCHDGSFLAIETKAPGKRNNLSPNQERRIMEIHAANGRAVVIDDVAQLTAMEEAWKLNKKLNQSCQT